jgi:hypothetical protein
MSTVTIPKKMIRKNDDLVLIPRKEYEAFKVWERREEIKLPRTFKTFKPTKAQLKDFEEARREHRKGIYLTLDELKRKLGIAN